MRCRVLFALLSALTAVPFLMTARLAAQPSHFGGPEPARPRDTSQTAPVDRAANFSILPGTPREPVLGRIVWVDPSGKRAVAWLSRADTPVPPERFLGARDEVLAPTALLRFSGQRGARAVGLVVEKGAVRENEEVVLPGAAMLSRLNRLALADGLSVEKEAAVEEKMPAPDQPAPVPSAPAASR